MNSSQLLGAMCAAMLTDEWLERVQDEIDALPEAFEWEDDCHFGETLDLIDDIAEREFIRHGGG